jgi:predicted MFS family arabinose efflux permease
VHRRLAEPGALGPPPSSLETFRQSLALLATKRFGTFWFASLLSSIGTWAQQVAEPWLLLTLGASSFLIGLDSFAATTPMWLLTLVGGALADRRDRRQVIALFQSIQMLCPIAIVVLLITGRVQPWMIIGLSVVVGVTDALSMPSFQSIVPSLVRREEIATGLALNSTQFNLSRIVGPSIAGLLMSSLGAMTCFMVSAASYVPFIGVALWILPRGRPIETRLASAHPRPWTGIGDLLRQPILRGALLTVLTTSVFCAPLITFSPVLVRDVFHGTAGRFSATVAAFGIGGLLGATGLLGLGSGVDRRRLSAACAIGYGGVLVLTALTPWYGGLPVLFVFAGAVQTLSNTSANTLLQATARPHLLGQTVSLYMLAINAGVSIGAVLTGTLVSLFGIQHALLANGITAVGLHAAVAWTWARRRAATDAY